MKKNLISLITLITLLKLTTSNALAFCPACTLAVGVGLGLSRYLGVDDSVSGIWVGALILSSGLWFSGWLKKKGIKLLRRRVVVTSFFYLITLVPLYTMGFIGHPFNTLWGIDKLVLGIAVGSILFLFSLATDRRLRAKNSGKVFVYYQKIIIPTTLLITGSVLFFFLTKR